MRLLAILASSALAGGLIAAAALAQETPRRSGFEDGLRSADADGDGSITAAEARAARERRFARLDANGDGYLTEEDRRIRVEQARQKAGERRRRSRDTDGDGRVSREEFVASGMPWFDRIDANNNDLLEPSEIDSIRARGRLRGGKATEDQSSEN